MKSLPLPDLLRVLDALPHPWQPLCRLLLETGARYQEIACLTWGQVDEDGIRIEEHEMPDGSLWRPKRPASVRKLIIPLPSPLNARGEAARGLPELIWWPMLTKPLTVRSCNRALEKACKALSVTRITSHDFRRARIVQALAAGGDPNSVRAAVGHRSLMTTIRYLRDVPVQGTLPALDAEPAANPVAAQYLQLARRQQWQA